jgi:hypothetical protein
MSPPFGRGHLRLECITIFLSKRICITNGKQLAYRGSHGWLKIFDSAKFFASFLATQTRF